MKPIEVFTDFDNVVTPGKENKMSRRYLQVIQRWIPVGMQYWNEWAGRPNCGHFFGGVLWYGQETAGSIATLAIAASSPEFDAQVAGKSADELKQVALMGLRYLCFTHDTGPADCVRPLASLGRKEPAGTKWGEKGRGFFPESQCGRTIANLAVTAALIRDLLGDEEREMLANIAADYMQRFGEMAPRSGVYNNTQTEENAWTAEGMVACMMLLPEHPLIPQWLENTKLWMFRTSTMPQDTYDYSVFAEEKTVSELCGMTYTTLPDCTAENHGFVHPSYMGSSVGLSGNALNLLKLYNQPFPPHIFWHRRDIYELLKSWCDDGGAPHCVQGMDWPYFAYPGHCFFHAVGNLYLNDPDAAYLERSALEVVERSSLAHGGRMVPEDVVRHCHGIQDPALMRERMVLSLAETALAHRLAGPGQELPEAKEFQRRLGVHVYPHGGVVLHRHERGINSFAWRNRTMALPATRDGMKLIGPAAGSMLGQITVRDKVAISRQIELKIRESDDSVCALLVEDIAENTVRRQVLFASLPNGKCITAERLIALKDITVERVMQGYLSIINDGFFGEQEDMKGLRHIFWEGNEQSFQGYPTNSDKEDVEVDLGDTRWVNIDNRCGLVFQGTGRAIYRNRHYFNPWHAIEDDLVLSLNEKPSDFSAGQQIAALVALWCPEQTHEDTARQKLVIHETPDEVFVVEADGYLCACNFDMKPVTLPIVEATHSISQLTDSLLLMNRKKIR